MRRLSRPVWAQNTTSDAGRGFEQREHAAEARRQHVLERAAALDVLRLRRFGEAREDLLALARREARAFRKQHHAVARAEVAGELAHARDLGLAAALTASHEGVGQPLADDVEARIPEQLALHHVAELQAGATRHQHGGQQRVDHAGMPHEEQQRSVAAGVRAARRVTRRP